MGGTYKGGWLYDGGIILLLLDETNIGDTCYIFLIWPAENGYLLQLEAGCREF